MAYKKPLQFLSPCRMEVAAVLYFLRKGVKLHFYSLGTICEENMRVSRGVRVSGGDLKMRSILKHRPSRQARRIPRLWVPNRGEKHPCWHTILLAKSSVLYLLRPLTLERGCPTPDRHFSAAAEQMDFVATQATKTKD